MLLRKLRAHENSISTLEKGNAGLQVKVSSLKDATRKMEADACSMIAERTSLESILESHKVNTLIPSSLISSLFNFRLEGRKLEGAIFKTLKLRRSEIKRE